MLSEDPSKEERMDELFDGADEVIKHYDEGIFTRAEAVLRMKELLVRAWNLGIDEGVLYGKTDE